MAFWLPILVIAHTATIHQTPFIKAAVYLQFNWKICNTSLPRQKNFDKKYLVFVMFQHLLLFDFWMTQIHGSKSVFHVWNVIMTKTFLRRDRQRPGRKFIKQNFEWMSRREKTEKWTFTRVDVKKSFYDKWVFFC